MVLVGLLAAMLSACALGNHVVVTGDTAACPRTASALRDAAAEDASGSDLAVSEGICSSSVCGSVSEGGSYSSSCSNPCCMEITTPNGIKALCIQQCEPEGTSPPTPTSSTKCSVSRRVASDAFEGIDYSDYSTNVEEGACPSSCDSIARDPDVGTCGNICCVVSGSGICLQGCISGDNGSDSKGTNLGVAVGVPVALVLLCCCCCAGGGVAACLCIRRKKQAAQGKRAASDAANAPLPGGAGCREAGMYQQAVPAPPSMHAQSSAHSSFAAPGAAPQAPLPTPPPHPVAPPT